MVKDHSSKLKKGFTLIELLIAIAIIALLGVALLATGGMRVQLAKARDGKRKADFKKMANILEDYYNDKNHYPETDIIQCRASLSPYINSAPCEPNGKNYLYMSCENGQGYVILTNLDNMSDPAIKEGECSDGCEVGAIGTYNFGICSPNITLTDLSNCLPPEVACKTPNCPSVPETYCADVLPGACCDSEGEHHYIITCFDDGQILCCPYLGE